MPIHARFARLSALSAALSVALGCGSSSPKVANAGSGDGGASGSAAGASGTVSTSSSGAASGLGSGTEQGGSEESGGALSSGSAGSSAGDSAGTSTAAQLARKLGRPAQFLIGMGADLDPTSDHSKDGAYLLGTTLDLHYAYLVGLLGKGGWPDWNAGGTFVNVLTDSADAKGVIPMFSLYSMAAYGDGNLGGLTDDAYMKPYFAGLKLLYERIGVFGKPAMVHLEPDFWAYAELQSKDAPANMKVNVTANAPDCAGLSNDLVGMGHCMVKLARLYAPKALIGFHASQWSAGDPKATVAFLKAVGADQADVVFADLLDRDAGCFEAGTDPVCMRGGSFYWDESNTTSPNFHDYLAWSKAIGGGLGRPLIWWQIPFGVPSATKGGRDGHYRDNRVHYIFSHIDEFVAAGGLGAVFGAGAVHQTTPATDGDQFKKAVAAYFAKPVPLP